jgi:hypothetical protein
MAPKKLLPPGGGHGEKLSRLQERAIAALMAHPSITAAAEELGISRSSLWEWTNQPAFAAAYLAARRAFLDHAIGRLVSMLNAAIDGLVEESRNANSPATRVKACDVMLGHARGAINESILHRELARLRDEVARLEGLHAGSDEPGTGLAQTPGSDDPIVSPATDDPE